MAEDTKKGLSLEAEEVVLRDAEGGGRLLPLQTGGKGSATDGQVSTESELVRSSGQSGAGRAGVWGWITNLIK